MKIASLLDIIGYSIASFGIDMVNAFCNHCLPLYLRRYPLPAWLVGVLAQQDSSIGGIEQIFIGLLSDRTRTPLGRRRPYFLVGVPLAVISLLFLATFPPMWAVVLILTLFASFMAIAKDPYKSLLGDVFASEQRGRVGAAMALFKMLGQVATLLIAFQLWEDSRSLVFYLVGAGLTLTFTITFFATKEPPPPENPPSLRQFNLGAYVRDISAHREVMKYGLCALLLYLASGGAVPFMTRFGVEVLGVSESRSYLLVMVLVLSTALFTVPSGLLGDRFGKKRILSWGLAGFAVVAMVGSQAQNELQGVVLMALVGVPNAVATTLGFPLFVDLMPSSRVGEFTGFSALVMSLPEAVGAALMGAFIDVLGSYRAVFIATSILIAASFLVLQTVHPERALIEAQSHSSQ